jgi:uncharacterized protein YybS (DUF2232 family)
MNPKTMKLSNLSKAIKMKRNKEKKMEEKLSNKTINSMISLIKVCFKPNKWIYRINPIFKITNPRKRKKHEERRTLIKANQKSAKSHKKTKHMFQ